RGEGVNEVGYVEKVDGHRAPNVKPGDVIVRIDSRYFRPAEVETLLGDPSKAAKELGWIPEVTLEEMVAEMVAHDLKAAERHSFLLRNGFDVPAEPRN